MSDATLKSGKKSQTAPLPDGAVATSVLGSRERFLNACRCQKVDRPPVWLMRQAGRALPEYRKLKEKHSFLELVQTPELAAEVTLQPIRRFGFDAAILFSDILVIPEAMGQPYRFRETGGIEMDFAVRTKMDVQRLTVEKVVKRLRYVDKALRLLRKELGDKTALIGFSGSPWTLATFMMEGGSAGKYTRALELFREDPKTFRALAAKLTEAIAVYLEMQIAAGVDAVQIFDSHGGHLSQNEFQAASGMWMKRIISRLGGKVPVIAFSLGTHHNWDDLVATGANVLGIDWQFPLREVQKLVPDRVALQGNLPPALLVDSTPEVVARETSRVLLDMLARPGHIFNLGHGLPPGAKLENIEALVTTVRKCA
ncbi:MAG TPA: uroporphyrinogen decarboxylase [Candidatus Polarisedimenticolia bacterium]|nr:uroporphyrinogen decarboxylase [Candidatus Polarisedimenticolia bacterium]